MLFCRPEFDVGSSPCVEKAISRGALELQPSPLVRSFFFSKINRPANFYWRDDVSLSKLLQV